ncbi:acetyl-CoA carboxylase biotin carboxylase subunit [Spongiactinospora rosea]|uniref:biotin carboxylase n=1 Tax=Spongiactinospora rosea TaxID=2248750 RepID=A0A366M4P1_9ACTN|nr:biotin carboxylase N-terminal domain-containing protein [Spongiactinospora rosea]RBQ20793.1 acetyl-CoA carboxylase biotin carboxylase subunit [Spongiactinospora rosea]
MFDSVLIANRGEIALRVARTCKEMGIRTIAVYSSADEDSPVVHLADEAVRIGPPQAKRSYLYAPAVLQAAHQTGAQAVHPGYGFLSEDADFAEMCRAEGLTFIGPPPEILAMLGDKAEALRVLSGAGIDVLPGTHRPIATAGEAADAAAGIGFPIIVKALAGGGGRGMAIARRPSELADAYAQARNSAQAVFGDERVYLERYVESARHVEVQVLAGTDGQVLHLGARDCSVQRRRQKLIEETPVPGLPERDAARLCEQVVAAARAIGYVGAGTFEFLLDDAGRFHCIEVNCRIQVEHPVTEMITGVDLVREQLNVAATGSPGITQADIRLSGAAIECRINAEDPARGFLPSPGTVESLTLPAGPFTRVDEYVRPGMSIPPFYDPLLAKVSVWAPDREQAIARMERALAECAVTGPGIRTTTGFLTSVLAHPLFRDGKHTTALIENLSVA